VKSELLDPKQCKEMVPALDLYVFVIPQATVRQRRVVGAWVNRAIAGVDDSPAAFSPDLAHRRARVRHLMSGPACERRLVKTIRRGNRTDPDRFEKNIVARISTHAGQVSIVNLQRRIRAVNVSLRFNTDQRDAFSIS
jgi:hypothetical protein